jgi:hypothetical protein
VKGGFALGYQPAQLSCQLQEAVAGQAGLLVGHYGSHQDRLFATNVVECAEQPVAVLGIVDVCADQVEELGVMNHALRLRGSDEHVTDGGAGVLVYGQ